MLEEDWGHDSTTYPPTPTPALLNFGIKKKQPILNKYRCICDSHSCACISPGQNLELQQRLFGSSALLVLLQLSAQGLHGILNEGQQGWDVRSHQQHPLGHCVVLHCNGTHSSGRDGMHALHICIKEVSQILSLKLFQCCL